MNQRASAKISDSAAAILGLDRSRAQILDDLSITAGATNRSPLFKEKGLCYGFEITPRPSEFFVAQEFGSSSEDLRSAITRPLAQAGLTSIRADDFFVSGSLLCKISELIHSTPFGIYQLSRLQNRNVYLELGIALGIGKPFILVKDIDAEVAWLMEGIEYIPVKSYFELQKDFAWKLDHYLARIGQYHRKISPWSEQGPTVIVAHGGLDEVDYCLAMGKHLAQLGYKMALIDKPNGQLNRVLTDEGIPYVTLSSKGQLRLDELFAAVSYCDKGFYRIDPNAAPDSFLTLGIAIGLDKDWALVHREGALPPSDLRGLSTLSFDSFVSLDKLLKQTR